MTFYEREINRIKSSIYANQQQLEAVISTRRHIDANYDLALSLDALSRVPYVSKYHLLRLFKRYYGQTPMQYLIDKRIEKAKTHLENGMSSAETCYAIGFESPCSFSTLFKNKTGLTPSAFQKRNFHKVSSV